MKTKIISLLLAIVGSSVAFDARSQSVLSGAWKVEEITNSVQRTRIDTNPPPSLYLFTDGYYSIMWLTGEERPDFQPDVDVEDEEIIAAFDSFIAQSGSYEVSGSTITTIPMIKKIPGNTGIPENIEYRLEGDTLYLIQTQPVNSTNVRTRKLVRLD